jgi:hypothetical protein
MLPRARSLPACLAVLTCLVSSLAARAAAADQAEVRQVFAEWEKRRAAFTGVRYRAVGEIVFLKGSMSIDPEAGRASEDPIPPRDVAAPKKLSLLLDFTRNRHRMEKEEQYYQRGSGELIPRVTTAAFGGKELQTAIPREANSSPAAPYPANAPDVVVTSGNLRSAGFVSEDWPLFLGHGFVPTLGDHILPGRFKPPAEEDAFFLHGRGVHAERNCLVLRTQAAQHSGVNFDEYWVDPGRDSAVLRQVAYVNGKAVIDLDVIYQKIEESWLPQRWTVVRRDNRGQTIRLERMRLEEVTPNPPMKDSDFEVEIKPGMIIQRVDLAGSPDSIQVPRPKEDRLFRVAENGEWNPIINGVEQPRRWPAWVWWAGGIILPVLVLGVGWGYRYARKGRQSPARA